jgi:TetR/AcrR family transcriptional regulator
VYENFERTRAEEQERILQACIQQFAHHGYQGASTNAIVRQAGIPKGTLFFYFGNKKNLYLYVIDYAVKRYVEAMDRMEAEREAQPPSDLFERLLARGRLRMRFAVQEPALYRLFFNAFLHTPPEISAEIEARYADYAAESARRLYNGLDCSRFRPDVQVEKAIALVDLVLEGVFSRYSPQFRQCGPEDALALVEELSWEAREYFELLKHGLYQTPGSNR